MQVNDFFLRPTFELHNIALWIVVSIEPSRRAAQLHKAGLCWWYGLFWLLLHRVLSLHPCPRLG